MVQPLLILVFTFMSLVLANDLRSQDVNDQSGQPLAEELGSRWQSFIDAWQKEEAGTLAEFYTPEGWNITPGGAIKKGREQILEFYKGLFEANRSSQYSVEIWSIEGCEQQVVETGQFTVHWVRNDDSTWTFVARTVTHWQKGEDGQWYIRTFIFNNPPRN